MKPGKAGRRDFLKQGAAAGVLLMPSASLAGQVVGDRTGKKTHGLDILRRPDFVNARFGVKDVVPMQYAANAWTCPGVRLTAEPAQVAAAIELPIRVASDGKDLTYIHVRWKGEASEALLSLGDHWERSYGDLEWRGTVPDRVMPWYFLTFDGDTVNGYGVKTQPSAFCFWQRDAQGITLTIDLRNGGEATLLGDRELAACSVVTHVGRREQTIAQVGRDFCRRMCPRPRLPAEPIFGSNDWNYAYGQNTAAGILRDADLIASLAPAGKVRPLVVIDDGWQDHNRFPSMSKLAADIRQRQLRPGLWVRPLRAPANAPNSWLLPTPRFGRGSSRNDLAYDPTHPEALNAALDAVRVAVQWGYEFVKHDFTTYELFGRWGSEMHGQVALPGWHFHDRSRTNAEIVAALYQSIRHAGGDQTTILGCNTVGHLAAGIFESQRIADDTSGREWERTRRYGVNGLAHRIAQHRTFSHIDPDCVAITPEIGWRETSQWMDVVAGSGTSLFLSPEPSSITPEIESAMKDAMARAALSGSGSPVRPTEATTPEEWQFLESGNTVRTYDWCGPEGTSPFLMS